MYFEQICLYTQIYTYGRYQWHQMSIWSHATSFLSCIMHQNHTNELSHEN